MSGSHGGPNVFESSFDADEQKFLKAEDSEAWHGVTGLLLGLIGGGVTLAIIAVTLVYNSL